MSEPKTEADGIRRIAAGIHGWHLMDERIGARSDAYAVTDGPHLVLIDPLPLTAAAETALSKLGQVTAVCLTVSSHQRSAWRYRKYFGARVYAPRGSVALLEKPDRFYGARSRLPASLKPVHTPGPVWTHHVLLSPLGGGTLFAGDLLIHLRAGKLRFMQDQHHEDPALSRESAESILRLAFRNLCIAHGAPITAGAKQAVRDALKRDTAG